MAGATITTVATWIPELWSALTQDEAHKTLVIEPRLGHTYDGMLNSWGDTLNIPKMAEAAATEQANMTGTVVFDTLSNEGNLQLIINKMTIAARKVDSAAKIQSMPPLLDKTTKELGRAVAERIDTLLAEAFDNFSQGEGTDGVALLDTNVRDAVQLLDEANAPKGKGDRTLFVSPATYMDMLGIEIYRNSLYSSVQNMAGDQGNGYVGSVYDLAVYESNNLKAGAAGHVCAALHRDALEIAKQTAITTEMLRPHDEIADAIRVWIMWGFVEARDDFGVELLAR